MVVRTEGSARGRTRRECGSGDVDDDWPAVVAGVDETLEASLLRVMKTFR